MAVVSVAASADPGETLPLMNCACCRRRSVIRLVSKSAENPGRVFFKCPNHKKKDSIAADGDCDFFFWIEAYVEKLLKMGVQVHPLELECLACLAAEEKVDELGPLTAAAISAMQTSSARATEAKRDVTKRRFTALSTDAEKHDRNKMREDVAAQMMFRLDMILGVCVLILGVSLFAARK